MLNNILKHHLGFSLAEVLTTLGIIGVVASMTIPQVINKYEKSVIETNLKKTYSELAQAIKRSEVDNDDFWTWDYSLSNMSGSFAKKYIEPYITLKVCDKWHGAKETMKGCFESSSELPTGTTSWKKANGQFNTGASVALMKKYKLTDGRTLGIENWYFNDSNKKYVKFVVDTNGQRGRTIMGEDVFMFCLMHYKYGNKLFSGLRAGDCENGGSAYRLKSEREYSCSRRGDGQDCAYFLEQNNWKFPKDYPLKF